MSTTVDLGKITASVTVGTTTTGAAGTNASVSNSGTTQDAVLNFTIPRGAQGIQGPQGVQGNTGPAGPTGPQGPMGDVAVITPEQQAAFTMYSVPGQNTDGPMTQKAVTDNLVASAISYDNSASGLASDNVQGALDETAVRIGVNERTSFDYTDGYISPNGVVTSSSAFHYTNPIFLFQGDTITVVTASYLFAPISLYENGVYTPIYAPTSGDTTTLKTYVYTAINDCYVVACVKKSPTPSVTIESDIIPLSQAKGIKYNNSHSGLSADNVQDALDINANVSEDCKNINGGTETVNISLKNTDFGNTTAYWNKVVKGRLTLGEYAVVDVRNCVHIKCVVPYSTVSSDTHIDRVTIPSYNINKEVIAEADLGWFLFNGSTVTIEIDLTQSVFKDVAYIGLYFGALNANTQIYASSLDLSNVILQLTMKNIYYNPAANSVSLYSDDGLVHTMTEDDLVQEHYDSKLGNNISRGFYLLDVRLLNEYTLSLSVSNDSTIKAGVQLLTEYNQASSIIELDSGWITAGGSYVLNKSLDVKYIGLIFTYISKGSGIPTISEIQQYITFSFTYKSKGLIERVSELERKRTVYDLLDKDLNIISHLGGGSFEGQVAPLNSMWSAMLAARMGMRCCEFDIVFTSDDVPICAHDLTLDGGNHEFVRKDGGAIQNISIGSLTYNELISTYEYRNGYAGYKSITTLYDNLAVYRANNIIPCVEIKNAASEMTENRYSIIINSLKKYVGNRCMCGAFDKGVAIRLRGYWKDLCIGIGASNASEVDTAIEYAKKFNFFVGLRIDYVTAEIVDKFNSNKVPFYGWTVDYDIDAALKLGLRMFICNYVAEGKNNKGIVNSQVSNNIDFSNITHNGTVTDGILTLASGQSATITANISSWLSSVELHVIIKGTCTIVVNGVTFNVSHANYSEYLVQNIFHDVSQASISINGVCEIVGINATIKSY